jgi:hypothetical protein
MGKGIEMPEISDEVIAAAAVTPLGANDAGASTVAEYLRRLLAEVWREEEGFDGKRPFGNSSWQWEVYRPLVQAGFIPGSLDADGYLDDVDDAAAGALVQAIIKSLSAESVKDGEAKVAAAERRATEIENRCDRLTLTINRLQEASSATAGEPALTSVERQVIRDAGRLYTRITSEVIGDGPTRDADAAELASAIHTIQRMVLAQAAARLFPDEFRLLGEAIKSPHDD